MDDMEMTAMTFYSRNSLLRLSWTVLSLGISQLAQQYWSELWSVATWTGQEMIHKRNLVFSFCTADTDQVNEHNEHNEHSVILKLLHDITKNIMREKEKIISESLTVSNVLHYYLFTFRKRKNCWVWYYFQN